MGIHVIRLGGGPAGPLPALVRSVLLCLVIPAVIFDPDHRGLHDKAMNTVLVRMYPPRGWASGTNPPLFCAESGCELPKMAAMAPD
jgi:uncharacterized RDD family membrane protein YckC